MRLSFGPAGSARPAVLGRQSSAGGPRPAVLVGYWIGMTQVGLGASFALWGRDSED